MAVIGLYGIAGRVSETLEEFFPVLWLAGLAVALVWALSRKVSAPSAGRTVPRPIATTADYLALTACAMFTAFYVFIICYRVDFGDIDTSIYTWSLLHDSGVNYPIWPSSGRFFPLGHQEFDLLRHLDEPLTGFFVLSVLQLVALLIVLYWLLDEFRVWARSLILALALVTPSIYIAFSGLIYQERNLLLLVAVIALCIRRYSRRPSVWLLVAALTATQLALYYKEPAFLLLMGFAGIPILQSWLAPDDGPRSIRRAIAAHPIESGMLILCLGFLLMYAGIMLPHRSLRYAEGHVRSSTPLGTLTWFLQVDPILIVFFLTLAYRATRLVTRREGLDPFWDALAVGGVLYFASYVALGIRSTYYTSPTDLVAILYVAERARKAVAAGRMRAAVPVGLAVLLAVPLVAGVWYTAVRRKNLVQGKVALAEFVRRTADTSSSPLRVFLPRQTNYAIMEFGALLMYRGGRVVAESVAAGRAGVVILEGSETFPGGRCVSHRPVPCSHADRAVGGTLVLTFPNDEASPDAAVSLRPEGGSQFVYQPFAIPRVLPWVKRIQMVLGDREVSQRPDWLWAYAAVARGEGRPANGGRKAE